MLCKFCGAPAREIRTGHYRCDFCSNEFDDEVVAPKPAAAPVQAQPIYTNVAPKQDGILSGEQIYDKAIASVVEINAKPNEKNSVFCASGFVISEIGLVLTNAHAVIDENGQVCNKIYVKAGDGTREARVVALGGKKGGEVDLCILYVEGLRAKACDFGNSSALKNGQKVYLIGNSLGSGTCITSGIISDKERKLQGVPYPYIMTDAAANHGNSGGPLLDECGKTIGVLVAGVDGAKGMNYAIPSEVATSFVSYVINNSDFRHANIKELTKYSKAHSQYSTGALLFTGVRLLVDVIEYIVSIFKRKRDK